MSRYNKPIDFTRKAILLQGLVLAATIALLVWIVPRDDRSTLRFDKDRPWLYGKFIAPYDFPILKTEAQLAEERDSIRRLYEPYLQLSPQTESAQITKFRSDFRQYDGTDIPATYRTFIEGRMHQVYARGIISNNDQQTLLDDSVVSVRVYSGNEATSRRVSRLLTQKAAYDFLLAEADSLGYSRLKLQKLSLNQYLEPNLSYDKAKSDAEWKDLVGGLSTSSGWVQSGQSIIDRGGIVDEKTYQILKSFEHAQGEHRTAVKENRQLIFGQVLYVMVICTCLLLDFNLFRRD